METDQGAKKKQGRNWAKKGNHQNRTNRARGPKDVEKYPELRGKPTGRGKVILQGYKARECGVNGQNENEDGQKNIGRCLQDQTKGPKKELQKGRGGSSQRRLRHGM